MQSIENPKRIHQYSHAKYTTRAENIIDMLKLWIFPSF